MMRYGPTSVPMRGSRFVSSKRFEGGRLAIGVVEELVSGVVIRREQFRHFVPQLSIRAASFAKVRRALRRIKVEGGVK